METETKLEAYDAELVSSEDGKNFFLVLKVPNNPQKILLSDTDQADLDKVFYLLIKELLAKPFKFSYKKNENTELVGMNQACEKYVEILNNDLQGILDEGKTELIAPESDLDNKASD